MATMRTDVTVSNKFPKLGIRCPHISSPGRPSYVNPGDYVAWNKNANRGRIIGSATVDEKLYLVVAMILLSGMTFEYWVLPDEITDTAHGSGSEHFESNGFGQWFYSSSFLKTPIDVARDTFNLLPKDLLKY